MMQPMQQGPLAFPQTVQQPSMSQLSFQRLSSFSSGAACNLHVVVQAAPLRKMHPMLLANLQSGRETVSLKRFSSMHGELLM